MFLDPDDLQAVTPNHFLIVEKCRATTKDFFLNAGPVLGKMHARVPTNIDKKHQMVPIQEIL